MKRQSFDCQFHAILGCFLPKLLHPAGLQAWSSLQSLQKLASGHQDIGKREQHHEFLSVFFELKIAYLYVLELALDQPKRILDLGTHVGLEHLGLFHQSAQSGQLDVDDLQDLGTQVVFFQNMPEPQAADPVTETLSIHQPHTVLVEARVEQSLLSTQVEHTATLLLAANTQHYCQIKRAATRLGQRCMRRNQRQELTLGHNKPHQVERYLFESAPQTAIKAKVGLFLAEHERKLSGLVMQLAGEF